MIRGFVAAAMALLAQPAAAVIVSGTMSAAPVVVSLSGKAVTPVASQGQFLKIDPEPAIFAVGRDNFQDEHVRGFDERQGVVLDRVLRFDNGGQVAAGTRVSSHLIAFDAPSLMSATGTVTFGSRVLGVISTNGQLARSDFLGLPGVTYELPRARGLEAETDFARVLGRSVAFRFVTNSPGDSIRVITAAVPEPASWAMLVGGFGLVGVMVRRRRGGAAASGHRGLLSGRVRSGGGRRA